MKKKIFSYLGFAKKSGNLVAGVNTCSFALAKRRVKLMILAEDISENSEKKIMKEIRRYGVKFVKYGSSDELSHAVGTSGRSVFAVCNDHFSEAILNVINGEAE